MSIADTVLVRMAEIPARSALLTVDRGFKIHRKHGRHVIPLVVPQGV